MTPRPTLAAAVLLAVLTTACQESPPAVEATSTEQLVRQWQQRSGAPAVVVAIDTPQAPIRVYASGSPTPGGAPVSDDAPFRIASITKMLVATVTLQLVDEGTLELDVPAGVYLPGEPLVAEVTIRQLLHHTSGIPDYGIAPGLGQQLLEQRDRTWNAQEVLDLVRDARREFSPGDSYSYSNTNYVLLGQIIEHITGRTWADEVRTRIIRPLDLQDTHIPSHNSQPAKVVAGYFDADNDGDTENLETGPWPALETSEGPAGAAVSTAPDVTRITRAILDGTLLPAELAKEMASPGPHGRRYDSYGLGVELSHPDRRTLAIGHGGFLPGFRSVTWYIPEHDTVITVLTNETRTDPTDLAELILRRLPLH
jgi:D-alanyl-D-alanine carboxypeptidase